MDFDKVDKNKLNFIKFLFIIIIYFLLDGIVLVLLYS